MKFSVFCEQTRKLFDTFLHPVDDEEDTRRPRRPSSPTPNRPKTSSYSAPSRRTSGSTRSDVRMFATDSKRRRRAAALLYKSSVMRRSWQALNQPPPLSKNQTTMYLKSSMTGSSPYGPYSSVSEEVVRRTDGQSPVPTSQSPPVLVSSHAISSNGCMSGSAAARDDNPVTTSEDSVKPLVQQAEQRTRSIGANRTSLPAKEQMVTTTTTTAPTAASPSRTTTGGKRLQESSQVLQSKASSVTYSCISSVSSLVPPPPPLPPTVKSFESQGNHQLEAENSSTGRKTPHDDASGDKKKKESEMESEMRSSPVTGEAVNVDDGSSTASSASSCSSSASSSAHLLPGSGSPLSPTASPSPQDVDCKDCRHKDNKSRDDLIRSIGNKHNNKSHDGSHARQSHHNSGLLVRKARRPGFSSRIIRKHSLSRDRHNNLQPRADHVTIDIREKFSPEQGSVIKVTVKEKMPHSAPVTMTDKCPRLHFNSNQEPDVVDQLSVLTVDCKHDVLAPSDGKESQERGSPGSGSYSSCCSSSSPASSSTSAYFSSTSSPPSSITSAAVQFRSGILKDRSNYSAKGCVTLPSGRVVNGFPKKVHFAESSINVFSCSDGNDRHAVNSHSTTLEPVNGRESGFGGSCSNTRLNDGCVSSPAPQAPTPPSPPSSRSESRARGNGVAPPNRSVKAMISHFNSKGLDLSAGGASKGSPDAANTSRPSKRPTCDSASPPTPANTRPVLLSGTQDDGRDERSNERLQQTGGSPSLHTRSSVRKHDSPRHHQNSKSEDQKQLFTSSSSIYLQDSRNLSSSRPESPFLVSESDQSLGRQSPNEKTVTQHFRSIHCTVSPHSQSIQKQISSIRQHFPPSASSSPAFSPASTPVSCLSSSASRTEDRRNCVIHTAV